MQRLEAIREADLEAGFHHGVSFADYLEIPAVNQSIIKLIMGRSPAHAKVLLERPREPSDRMATGTFFHYGKLEPQRAMEKYIVMPAFEDDEANVKADNSPAPGQKNTKWYRERVAKWEEEEADGKQVVTQEKYDSMLAVCEQLSSHPDAAKVFERENSRETTIIWKDLETDLWCKARADALIMDVWPTIADLKTTSDASEEAFEKSVIRFRYDVQAAWYITGVVRAAQQTGKVVANRPNFLIIAVEQDLPHAINVFDMGEWFNCGKIDCTAGLYHLKTALDSGHWPGYDVGVKTLECPSWYRKRFGVA